MFFFGLKEIFAKKILFSVHLEGRVEQRMFNSIANLLEQALTEKQPINPDKRKGQKVEVKIS